MQIDLDEAGWNARTDLSYLREGDEARFLVKGGIGEVRAHIAGDKLELFPERSHGQRSLLAVLGIEWAP